MTPTLAWTPQGFTVNGTPAPLISGEFHYFRVPKSDWRERLILLKQSGANTVATYIPWIIHEPEEGTILFDDIPERSLTDFLKLCCELEIMVIARPGPYSYSELCRDGLPFWMADNYPETISHGPHGEFNALNKSASYLHPVFLDRARRYIRAVDETIKPFLVTNGGCIVSVQADNEIAGIHVWRGFIDCNKEGMGIGTEGGRFVCYLKEKFETVANMNAHYGSHFSSFMEVNPFCNTPSDRDVGGKRFFNDYLVFYRQSLELYIRTLCEWFEEDGIDVDYCTNAGGGSFIPLMRNIPEQNQKHRFLLGVDHYYALSPAAGISMTPEKTVKYLLSMDLLRALGMPPSVLEMQSGSMSCYPPLLPENLYGFYMTHVALGMKGSNYYVFTGGPNYANTGNNTTIYDYHAPVSATGEIRPMYYVQKKRNEYSLQNDLLLSNDRSADVQLGFTWDQMQYITSRQWKRHSAHGLNLRNYRYSVLLSLGLSAALPVCRPLSQDTPTDLPFLLVTDERMSPEDQQNAVDFIRRGGRLMLTPTVPYLDEDYLPCTILRDFLSIQEVRAFDSVEPLTMVNGEKVYGVESKYTFDGFEGDVLATDDADGTPIAVWRKMGSGAVALLGASFEYSQFCQLELLELCLGALGYERRVKTDCRNLNVTLFEDGERAICFLINNLAGAVRATLSVKANGRVFDLGTQTVDAMSVLPIELK
ncbi:MAG: beta-galactosidase [Clostridia bacterium]|nr:beta-galactosidase [Clostridia bacterium]